MTDKKQTAVNYLIEKIGECESFGDIMWYFNDWVAKALEMEQEQLYEMWQGGINCTEEGGKSFEDYYNEVYKQTTE